MPGRPLSSQVLRGGDSHGATPVHRGHCNRSARPAPARDRSLQLAMNDRTRRRPRQLLATAPRHPVGTPRRRRLLMTRSIYMLIMTLAAAATLLVDTAPRVSY